jgi:ATP-dependent HslUV protease ATP-binding subunit HslU
LTHAPSSPSSPCLLPSPTRRRVLFSSDPSFPFAGTVAYCIYQFQQKRVKRDPEGPFLFGNPMAGAVLSTLCCLAVACGVMAVLTTPLAAVMGQSARQVGAFIAIVVMGVLGMYLK